MDEYLKTKEEIVKHFDVYTGLIAKAERIIAIMAKWRQRGNPPHDSWAMQDYKGVEKIDIGEKKESIIATVILPQYRSCVDTDLEIEIPIEYFNMTEEEIDKQEEQNCELRIKAYMEETNRRDEEEKNFEKKLYEQLKKKYG